MRVGMTGNDGLSEFLKVYITKEITDIGQVTVVGYIGEGATYDLTSQWNPPFENDNLGDAGYLQKTAEYGQALTGLTAKSEFNTLLNWQGIEPPAITLPIHLKAFNDAKSEVEDPIMFLEMMASPELNEALMGGQVPQPCVVDIGRKIKLMDCVILNVQSELDSPKTRQGYRSENTVQLQVQAMQMLNQSEIQNIRR